MHIAQPAPSAADTRAMNAPTTVASAAKIAVISDAIFHLSTFSVVRAQRQEQDDWNWHTEKPQQNSASHKQILR
jgi:hypothetical protein